MSQNHEYFCPKCPFDDFYVTPMTNFEFWKITANIFHSYSFATEEESQNIEMNCIVIKNTKLTK